MTATPVPPTDDAYLTLLKQVLTASVYDESAWSSLGHGRSLWRRWLHRWLSRRRLMLVRTRPMDTAARREGRDWPLFGYTMAGELRLDNVRHCVETVLRDGVPGDLIETGVWRGGTTIFMRALLKAHGVTDRRVWVADSFEGLPAPEDRDDGSDYSMIDMLKVPLARVQANFAAFGLLDDQVGFLPGWFKDTLPTAPIARLAVLRLDGDLHSSTRDALVHLHPRVSPGGFVIVDDYLSWPGCRRAVDEYRAEHGIDAPIEPIDWTAVCWRLPR